ncbi:MAG: metallopeptidase family protein [Proteobacteria bacterium]|nr:metallopeptidase family protein [Pseudomonadota bacterium]
MRVTRGRFEELAGEAVDAIPPFFRRRFLNVVIQVKGKPGTEAGGLKDSPSLLGLYTGLQREAMASPFGGSHLPARIILYQRNLESLCGSEEELRRRIHLTLRHEVAHHFGFSEEDIRARWPEGA